MSDKTYREEPKKGDVTITCGKGPIYFDPATGIYYYPMEAVEEKYQSKRQVIKKKPLLKFDKPTGNYLDVKTGEPYLELASHEEFLKLRQRTVKDYFPLGVEKRDDGRTMAGDGTGHGDGSELVKFLEKLGTVSKKGLREVQKNVYYNPKRKVLRVLIMSTLRSVDSHTRVYWLPQDLKEHVLPPL